jgi:hypothetical protein
MILIRYLMRRLPAPLRGAPDPSISLSMGPVSVSKSGDGTILLWKILIGEVIAILCRAL